jgi:hypothetical protein
MNCKICGTETKEFDNAEILGKYKVRYYLCSKCGFVQTEEPFWLSESYSKAIAKSDTGIMVRNLANSSNLLFFLKFVPNGSCLDFGGGHGILTRIMRDYGFDFYHYDKYAENLFAAGFEGDANGSYKVVTAFENFEHFVKPLEEIEKLINISETLYFTTLLLPSSPHKNWWYYAPDSGQHISFYSRKTLEYIAQKHNMFFITNNRDTHILSKKKVNTYFFWFLALYNKVNNLNPSRFLKRKSKTWNDMNTILSMFKGTKNN